MYYDEKTARALVIEAGHRLLENRLIARTWGNISARISENEFIITPSGRAYDTLTPEELVKVRIDDLSYEGDRKPSSEKGIHAQAYSLRPDCGFIIHTHQFYASALCAEGKSLSFAPCAKYGLPGTKKLCARVSACIKENSAASSFLLEKHGALLLGKDCEDAFSLAKSLEAQCREAFEARVGELSEEQAVSACAAAKRRLPAYIDDFAQLVGPSAKMVGGAVRTPASDDEEAVTMIVRKNCAAALYAKTAKPLSAGDALLQRAVYLLKYSKLKNR